MTLSSCVKSRWIRKFVHDAINLLNFNKSGGELEESACSTWPSARGNSQCRDSRFAICLFFPRVPPARPPRFLCVRSTNVLGGGRCDDSRRLFPYPVLGPSRFFIHRRAFKTECDFLARWQHCPKSVYVLHNNAKWGKIWSRRSKQASLELVQLRRPWPT